MAASGYVLYYWIYSLILLTLRPLYCTPIVLKTVVLKACCCSDLALRASVKAKGRFTSWDCGYIPCGGQQNISPQNMLLWHNDYFDLKSIEKKQIQEKLSDLPYLPKRRT